MPGSVSRAEKAAAQRTSRTMREHSGGRLRGRIRLPRSLSLMVAQVEAAVACRTPATISGKDRPPAPLLIGQGRGITGVAEMIEAGMAADQGALIRGQCAGQ